jgi:hypothetical protein
VTLATSFEAGEQVYATIYLPSKLRKMTDSYAVNNMEVKVNNMIVAPESENGHLGNDANARAQRPAIRYLT